MLIVPMGSVKQKCCDEQVPGTLEHNRCDGTSPAWFSTVVHVDTQRPSECWALRLRHGAVLIASSVVRGMWRTLWEP
jgi:hypothetical protein